MRSHQHVAEDPSEALPSSLPKDGRSHTRDKPPVIVAREHCHCTCPRRAARKLLKNQVGIGVGSSASQSSAQLTLEVEIRRGPAQQSTMHRLLLLVEEGATL